MTHIPPKTPRSSAEAILKCHSCNTVGNDGSFTHCGVLSCPECGAMGANIADAGHGSWIKPVEREIKKKFLWLTIGYVRMVVKEGYWDITKPATPTYMREE